MPDPHCDNCCWSAQTIDEHGDDDKVVCTRDFPKLRELVLCDEYIAVPTVEVCQ